MEMTNSTVALKLDICNPYDKIPFVYPLGAV